MHWAIHSACTHHHNRCSCEICKHRKNQIQLSHLYFEFLQQKCRLCLTWKNICALSIDQNRVAEKDRGGERGKEKTETKLHTRTRARTGSIWWKNTKLMTHWRRMSREKQTKTNERKTNEVKKRQRKSEIFFLCSVLFCFVLSNSNTDTQIRFESV